MGEYFDSAYVVTDGVILFYEDDDVSLRIPDKLGDMTIITIGAGAFMESNQLEFVNIPYGVKSIGDNAFKGCKRLKCVNIPTTVETFGSEVFTECPTLKNIRIYGYELSEEKYQEMKSSFRCANGSVYIASSFPDDKRIKDILEAACVGGAKLIQDGIFRLFAEDHCDSRKMVPMHIMHGSYGFDNKVSYISESDSIKELIENPEFADTDTLAESTNDRFFKSEETPKIYKTAILTFDDKKTRFENGKYYLLLDIVIAYHFWQSVVPVNLDGKEYYVYRRHFLSSNENYNYIRKEVSVVSDKGEKVSEKEAGMVNAKYRLLSIL